MKNIGRIGLLLALLSIGLTLFLVLGHPGARAQFLSVTFPVTATGERTVLMLGPIALSALATVASLLAVIRRVGRVGMGVAVLSWLLILLVLGREGLRYLF